MVDIGSVWDRTLEFVSDNIAGIVPVALTGVFIPLTLFGSVFRLALVGPPAEQIAICVGLLVLGLWVLWGKLAITALTLDPRGGRHDAARAASIRFVPAAGIGLLLFGVMVLSVVVLATLIAFFGTGSNAGEASVVSSQGLVVVPGRSIWLGLSLIAGFGIWLAARLSVVLAIIVMERRGLRVLGRSFRLTSGATLTILGVLILYLIVSIVAQIATRFVFGAFFSFTFGDSGSLATIFTSIVVSVISTGFTVLSTIFVTKLYLALRDARESIVNAR